MYHCTAFCVSVDLKIRLFHLQEGGPPLKWLTCRQSRRPLVVSCRVCSYSYNSNKPLLRYEASVILCTYINACMYLWVFVFALAGKLFFNSVLLFRYGHIYPVIQCMYLLFVATCILQSQSVYFATMQEDFHRQSSQMLASMLLPLLQHLDQVVSDHSTSVTQMASEVKTQVWTYM